jgi:hypothetical protein
VNNLKQVTALCLCLAFLSPHAKAMDNGYASGSDWIIPTALTATAFIKLLFTLLAVDRPETTEADFQSYSANNLEPIFAEFFRDNRNFRNVRRQIHENLCDERLLPHHCCDAWVMLYCLNESTNTRHYLRCEHKLC